MRTTNKQHPVYAYLVSALKDVETINLEYGVVVEDTIAARLQWTIDTFRREYVYPENVRRYGNEVNIFREWLMCLPSAIHVDFEYYRIIELAKEWGSIPQDATEKQEDKTCENWFNFIAMCFYRLCNFHNIQF